MKSYFYDVKKHLERMNKLTKMQSEITWEIEFEGESYTAIQMEDDGSGYYSWDIFGEDMEEPKNALKTRIIEYIIENQ
jgi:hypothetical protein